MSERKTKSDMSPIWSSTMRWLPKLSAALAFPVVIGHAYWALSVDCDAHFGRGGSVLVIMAVLSVFGLEDRMHRTSHMVFLNSEGAKPFKFSNPYIIAGILAMVGTLIWGYGDWFANYFGISSEGCTIAR